MSDNLRSQVTEGVARAIMLENEYLRIAETAVLARRTQDMQRERPELIPALDAASRALEEIRRGKSVEKIYHYEAQLSPEQKLLFNKAQCRDLISAAHESDVTRVLIISRMNNSTELTASYNNYINAGVAYKLNPDEPNRAECQKLFGVVAERINTLCAGLIESENGMKALSRVMTHVYNGSNNNIDEELYERNASDLKAVNPQEIPAAPGKIKTP